jgi:hypothetical protein
MAKKHCKTCKYMGEKNKNTICRKLPPAANTDNRWPQVDPETDWCGKHPVMQKKSRK